MTVSAARSAAALKGVRTRRRNLLNQAVSTGASIKVTYQGANDEAARTRVVRPTEITQSRRGATLVTVTENLNVRTLREDRIVGLPVVL